MDLTGAAIFLGAIVAVGAVFWGLVSHRRSVAFGVSAAAVAVLALLGAYYAWVESESTAWAAGYGVLAVAGLAAAFRHCAGGRAGTRPD